jgi:uncharacterized RDD family membrane protein YckC
LNVPAAIRKEPRAAFIRRWAATVIDLLVLGLGSLAMVALIPDAAHHRLPWIGGIVVAAIFLLYYVVGEGLLGSTVGKLVLHLRVVDETGNRPGIGRAMVRTLLRILEVNPLLAGGIPAGLVAYLSPTGQRLGDYASKTFVVQTSLLTHQAEPTQPQQ